MGSPHAHGGLHPEGDLASSFARALSRFHPLAGRLTADHVVADGGTGFVISLRCSGEGAELVHAVAPGVNHGVADGTKFWHLFNTWSEINLASGGDGGRCTLSTPPPEIDRWFVDGIGLVPIPLPFGKPEDIIRRPEFPPVQECFFDFSAESVAKLKAKANAETRLAATITISSLQSLLVHLWRGVCRARGHAPHRETTYILLVGCRALVKGIPEAYIGNAVTHPFARSAAGDVLGKGLGWTAFLLNRAVASFDEARVAPWRRKASFVYLGPSEDIPTVGTGSSPRFDVYGEDFGWGRPVAVRSGRREQAGREGDRVRGPWRRRQRCAGGVPVSRGARQARRRR